MSDDSGDDGVVVLDEDPEDEALLAELRDTVASADPVPDAVLAAARGSLTWLSVDAELAELLADSAETPVGAGARSAVLDVRLLTFAAGDTTVEVEVTEQGSRRRVVGQVVPPGEAEVRVRHAEGVTRVDADELGRFVADDLPAGPLSLVVRRPGQRPVVTSWTAV